MNKPFVINQTPQGSARCCDCLFASFDQPPDVACENSAVSDLNGDELELVPVRFFWSCRYFTPDPFIDGGHYV